MVRLYRTTAPIHKKELKIETTKPEIIIVPSQNVDSEKKGE